MEFVSSWNLYHHVICVTMESALSCNLHYHVICVIMEFVSS